MDMQINSRLWKVLAIGLPVVWVGVFLTFFYPSRPINAQAVLPTVNVLAKTTSSSLAFNPIILPPREKSAPIVAKGIYLTASSANNAKKMNEIIGLIDKTELNAVVIDVKDYTGYILYDSQIPLVKELKTKRAVLKNIPDLIKKLHDHNIYVIARQTVFQDPILAEKKPEWAIKNKQGGVWHDNKGLSWVDSARKDLWNYNIAIAKEVIDLGFDEINFDYVRFPTDGNMASAVIPSSTARNTVMANFYKYLSEQLKNEPAYISVDFFGLVMENNTGMSIGQKIDSASDQVDYISPMMYPSHYGVGHLGLKNPAASPGKVIDNGMKKGAPLFVDKRAQVRPWLQAFNIGAVYGAANIRAQIDMVEKYPNAGWLLWNAANRYTSAGLKLE